MKRVAGLKACAGTLDKDDDEYDRIFGELKTGYTGWDVVHSED